MIPTLNITYLNLIGTLATLVWVRTVLGSDIVIVTETRTLEQNIAKFEADFPEEYEWCPNHRPVRGRRTDEDLPLHNVL